MRIRKNAAVKVFCPLSVSSQSQSFAAEEDEAAAVATAAEKHVCQLNLSPWDAMFFSPFPHSPEEDENAGAGGASERLPTRKQEEEGDEAAGIRIADSRDVEGAKREKKTKGEKKAKARKTKKKTGSAEEAAPSTICKKTDGKGWQCKREAHHSHALCEYHLTQLRSYYANAGDENPAKKATRRNAGGGGTRGNTYRTSDFYYYSGFGPWWGKRRTVADVERLLASSEDPDAGEEDEEGSGGRRARKPIKARSLMSLI